MPTFQQLPSGKWQVKVRKSGLYRAGTFATKREARDWSTAIEAQANHVAAGGFAPVPKGATLGDLIDKYLETIPEQGRTKTNTLIMIKRELGKVTVGSLSALVLRDFSDRRLDAGAGGVTVSADLSFLSAVLKWGRHSRHLNINDRLALDARASLKHRGLKTRSQERDREPSNDELQRLYKLWQDKPRQKIPMEILCRFALASGMRQGEICRLEAEDVDAARRTELAP
jgi:integrase